MLIANAIYDVVFKYLMEDNKIAKLLLSSLLKQEIEELQLRPQEYTANIVKQSITVYRVDFKAKIRLSDGSHKVVLIEIQKAKYTTDLMRFRRYLGSQYASADNTIEIEGRTQPIEIVTIYFLGYNLSDAIESPIIRVNRNVIDNYTNESIKIRDEFIESLTHESIIVQIPKLKKTRRDDLERALSIFDTERVHEISINEEDYPDKYREVVRRLVKALQEPTVRQTMEIEDEILDDLENKERLIEKQSQIIEEMMKKEQQAQQQAEQERQRAEELKTKSVLNLNYKGFTIEEISETLGISVDEVNKILRDSKKI